MSEALWDRLSVFWLSEDFVPVPGLAGLVQIIWLSGCRFLGTWKHGNKFCMMKLHLACHQPADSQPMTVDVHPRCCRSFVTATCEGSHRSTKLTAAI